jgi:hypothetical protein
MQFRDTRVPSAPGDPKRLRQQPDGTRTIALTCGVPICGNISAVHRAVYFNLADSILGGDFHGKSGGLIRFDLIIGERGVNEEIRKVHRFHAA